MSLTPEPASSTGEGGGLGEGGAWMAFSSVPFHEAGSGFAGGGGRNSVSRSVLTRRCPRPYAMFSCAAIMHLACNCFRMTLLMFCFITQ